MNDIRLQRRQAMVLCPAHSHNSCSLHPGHRRSRIGRSHRRSARSWAGASLHASARSDEAAVHTYTMSLHGPLHFQVSTIDTGTIPSLSQALWQGSMTHVYRGLQQQSASEDLSAHQYESQRRWRNQLYATPCLRSYASARRSLNLPGGT